MIFRLRIAPGNSWKQKFQQVTSAIADGVFQVSNTAAPASALRTQGRQRFGRSLNPLSSVKTMVGPLTRVESGCYAP